MCNQLSELIFQILPAQPERYAYVRGSREYPQVSGMVLFYRFLKGTVVVADFSGLPDNGSDLYGFHIHEGMSCTETEEGAFMDAGGHFNPYRTEHPLHAGDLPVLLGNHGTAWSAVYTERFLPGEVAGRTVILHGLPDDLHTQPAGASGERIACGVIE